MNLRIKTDEFEIEIVNTDLTRFEKILLATFAHMEGQSFNEVYTNTIVDVPPTFSKKANYVEAINGVRSHPNGIKEYKCLYNCSCGNTGYRYVNEDAAITTCHKCKTVLYVQPATKNDAHDEDFNYFVAYG